MYIKHFTNKFAPRIPKRWLLLIAFLLWGFAGIKILLVAYKSFHLLNLDYRIIIPVILIGYGIFFGLLFIRVFRKHTKRIINKPNEWNCLFSFIDIKGYLIMIVMIAMGISLRKSGVFNPLLLGIGYSIMGLSLFSSSLLFLYAFFRYRIFKEKYEL